VLRLLWVLLARNILEKKVEEIAGTEPPTLAADKPQSSPIPAH